MLLASTADDFVVLRPLWPALLSIPRFARTTRWSFGNGAATLECRDLQQRRWLTDRVPGDALGVRFDFRRWLSAFARSEGTSREVGVVADDGTAVTLLHLERADPAFDELIWRMMSDEPAAAPPPLSRAPAPHAAALQALGPRIARRVRDDALVRAIAVALIRRLPLRLHVQNGGGSVSWTPVDARLRERGEGWSLHAGGTRLDLSSRGAATYAVEAHASAQECPAIERCAPHDGGWLRIDVATEPAATAAWRSICASLPEETV